jgi:hypothetical protein
MCHLNVGHGFFLYYRTRAYYLRKL